MTTEIDTRFFRAGVGTVIYNQSGQVVLFERAQNPVGIWQFQQGGIDLGEDTQTTLWRELKEEVGLVKEDFESVVEYPQWTVHQYAHTVDDPSKSRLGQVHRWFFLKLKATVEIDLSKASEKEASDYKWVTFAEAVNTTEKLKRHVYVALAEHFQTHVFTK